MEYVTITQALKCNTFYNFKYVRCFKVKSLMCYKVSSLKCTQEDTFSSVNGKNYIYTYIYPV